MNFIESQFSLAGTTAVVTGSRRGIGQALAVGLARAGARIVSFDRNEPKQTRSQILGEGGHHDWHRIDLSTAGPETIEQTVADLWQNAGPVQILVNNAGMCPRRPALSFSPEDWNATLQLNLTAAWLIAQAMARRMVAAGYGKIINIASMLSFQGGITVPAYAASKHGILGITRALANELASQGVNVNAIAPGYIRTDLTFDLEADRQRNRDITARIPAGRWATVQELQGTCVFLASAASNYIHGACIPVDGGWLSR
jgi:2-deoxy-D-gluconate 3-dehydrogenase